MEKPNYEINGAGINSRPKLFAQICTGECYVLLLYT